MKIQLLSNFKPEWGVPALATPGSAGFDLMWAAPGVTLLPDEFAFGGTGFALDMQSEGDGDLEGGVTMAGVILPRSGLGTKYGICLKNDIGLIDADYRGELKVCLENRSKNPFSVVEGMRVAQLVFLFVLRPEFTVVKSLGVTSRGQGGHGSTGV